MNHLFILIFLLSIICKINGQSIHFCQALRDNNWRIDYTISVSKDNSPKKFINIKKHFWELEYKPMPPKSDQSDLTKRQADQLPTKPFKPGPVFLKDVWSKKSEWLQKDYHLGLSINGSDANKKALILININSQTYDSYFFDSNSDVLNQNPDLDQKDLPTKFDDFKPMVAFDSSRDSNSVYLMEQKRTGKERPRYNSTIRGYTLADVSKGFSNDTSLSAILPKSINSSSDFYKIKGIFKTPNNEIIFLIEYCEATKPMPRSPANQKEEDLCNSTITYNYCIVKETEESPLNEGCHPAKVDNQQIADCSKPEEWKSKIEMTTIDSQNKTQSSETENKIDGKKTEWFEHKTTTLKVSKETNKSEEKSGMLWIIIIIVVVIIILILGFIIFCFVKRKADQKVSKSNLKGDVQTKSTKKVKKSSDEKKITLKEPSKSSSEELNSSNSLFVPSVRSSLM